MDSQQLIEAAVESGAQDNTVVALTGELDMSTRASVDALVQHALQAGTRDLTFEMSDVEFMDSQGLYALLGAQETVNAGGGRLQLRAPSAAVRLVIELTGLESRLRIQR